MSDAAHMFFSAPRTPARALALFGAGLLLGVSFVATPIKFAADVPLPQLVDIGRITLHTFGWVEWALVLGLVVTACVRPTRALVVVIVILAAILAVQQLWLRPVLDDRVAAHLAGVTPAPTWHHHAYIVGEVIELAVLLGFALVPGRGDTTSV